MYEAHSLKVDVNIVKPKFISSQFTGYFKVMQLHFSRFLACFSLRLLLRIVIFNNWHVNDQPTATTTSSATTLPLELPEPCEVEQQRLLESAVQQQLYSRRFYVHGNCC